MFSVVELVLTQLWSQFVPMSPGQFIITNGKKKQRTAVLEMACRQVAKCDQKSFWAISFGQKYVYLSPEELSLGNQL